MRIDVKQMQPPFTLRGIAEQMTAEGRKNPVVFKDVGSRESVTGLGVRVTPNGAKSFIYDRNLSQNGQRRKVRIVIGRAPQSVNDGDALTVPRARAIATDLNIAAQAGRDPRAVKLEQSKADTAALSAQRAERDRLSVSLREVWGEYLLERSPDWSDRHHADAIQLASPGGEPYKRGNGTTKAGPLASLMREPIAAIDQDRIAEWAKTEGPRRATQARLARRHLISCLRWCLEEGPKEWRGLVQAEALRLTKTAQRRLGKPKAKTDRLERPHLKPFFDALSQHGIPVTRDYIATLLLSGGRKNEITTMQWSHIDWRWKRIKVHDKATMDHRLIPMTPYMESILRQAQQRNDSLPKDERSVWVFASNRKKGEPLRWANKALAEICAAAGLPRLSIHGLRRSFGTLAESAGLPAGAIAQIQGHAPTAVAEKHYRARSIDELREYADRWEAWLLNAAEVEYTPESDGLRLVKGCAQSVRV